MDKKYIKIKQEITVIIFVNVRLDAWTPLYKSNHDSKF